MNKDRCRVLGRPHRNPTPPGLTGNSDEHETTLAGMIVGTPAVTLTADKAA